MTMFPHTITIYRLENEVYTRQIVGGVYWQETVGITPLGNGVEYHKTVTVITSPETTKSYGEWTALPRDYIIKGEGAPISSATELKGHYRVVSVAANTAQTEIDNITITGA